MGGLAAQGMRTDTMVSVFVINGNDISDSLPGVGTARAAHWARPRSLAGARSRSRSWPPARVRARGRAGAGGPGGLRVSGSGRSASPEKPSSRCISMPRRAPPPRSSCRPRACERELKLSALQLCSSHLASLNGRAGTNSIIEPQKTHGCNPYPSKRYLVNAN